MSSDAGALAFGDVVLVPFPFTDQSSAKRRPAVVVSAAAYNQRGPDVILMPISLSPGQGRGLPQLGGSAA